MQTAKTAVSRIEYRTNMMRADAEIIPLGYLVEACWDDARWMGMIYRPSLTVNEKREVNLHTWPELADSRAFLKELFEVAQDADDGEAGDVLARQYGCLSALTVHVIDRASDFAAGLASAIETEVQTELVKRLRKFEDDLQPACVATVMPFMPRRRRTAAKSFAFTSPARHEGQKAAVG
jgi:hypothetical protein